VQVEHEMPDVREENVSAFQCIYVCGQFCAATVCPKTTIAQNWILPRAPKQEALPFLSLAIIDTQLLLAAATR